MEGSPAAARCSLDLVQSLLDLMQDPIAPWGWCLLLSANILICTPRLREFAFIMAIVGIEASLLAFVLGLLMLHGGWPTHTTHAEVLALGRFDFVVRAGVTAVLIGPVALLAWRRPLRGFLSTGWRALTPIGISLVDLALLTCLTSRVLAVSRP